MAIRHAPRLSGISVNALATTMVDLSLAYAQ